MEGAVCETWSESEDESLNDRNDVGCKTKKAVEHQAGREFI